MAGTRSVRQRLPAINMTAAAEPQDSIDKSADEADAREWIQHARRGEFPQAWKASERILQRHRANPDFTRPRHMQSVWTGEPLDGKRVLIRCYHGLGDTIQFIRYVPHVRALAREVVVWAPAPLIPLLKSVSGIDRLMPLHDGAPHVEYDVDVEVMELPFVFRSTLDTIPRTIPYVSVEAAKLPGAKPRVGLAWRCGDWEHHRSMSFEMVKPLLDLRGITWCSIQLGRRPDETHPHMVDIAEADLHRTACQVAALDLLITIDSMPAHLAGALGVPVWTLLLKDADWRWMEEGEDSPWYPTVRLFRQQREGDWAGVMGRVREALCAREYELPMAKDQLPRRP
jgi:hypothetical protein